MFNKTTKNLNKNCQFLFSPLKVERSLLQEQKFDKLNFATYNALEGGRMYLNNYPERREPNSKLFGRMAANLCQEIARQ